MTITEKIYLSLCSTLMLFGVMGNIIYQKFVVLTFPGPIVFEISAGAILYPLTLMLTNLITEFYGQEKALFSVVLSVILNSIVAVILVCVDALPAVGWSPVNDKDFHQIFGVYTPAFMASTLALYVARRFDIFLYTQIRRLAQDRYLTLRNFVSIALSLLLDTCIVITLMVLWNALPISNVGLLIRDSYLWKIVCTLFTMPLFTGGTKLIQWLIKPKD